MKRSLFLLLVIFAIGAKPVGAAPKPVEVYVVIPSGYPEYFNFSQAGPEVESWMVDIESWIYAQTGKHFNYTVTTLYSTHSIYELSNGFDGCAFAPIPEGQGLGSSNLLLGQIYSEFNLPDFGIERHLFIVVGAGGHAEGAYYSQGQTNFGRAIIGDWGLSEEINIVHDPCNIYGVYNFPPYPPNGCDPRGLIGEPTPCYGPAPQENPCGTLGHEMLHAFGVDSHTPNVGCGDTLSSTQKRDLLRYNKAFLY